MPILAGHAEAVLPDLDALAKRINSASGIQLLASRGIDINQYQIADCRVGLERLMRKLPHEARQEIRRQSVDACRE